MNSNFIDNDLYEDIKSGTNIISGEEYKQTAYAISQLAADMVVKTLGPYGSTTIIDDSIFTYPSKDGWACINRLRFNDPIYNTIFNIIKQISFSIVNKVGDGTTSALIGANAFLNEVLKYQQTHKYRQVDFLKAIDDIKDDIINELLNSDQLHTIDKNGNFDDIYRVAYISSNSNDKLSDMIRTIYKETKNPNIFVTLDKGADLTYEIQTGYKFECNPIKHKAYINEDNGTCKKTRPTLAVVFDHNVNYNEHGEIITLLSKYANMRNMEIIIIAPYFDDIITTIIGTTVDSFLQQNKIPNIMLMQIPLSMDIHRQYLSDIVLLTNAQVFDYGKVRACNVLQHNLTHPEDEKIEDSLLQIDQYNFKSPQDIIETCIGTIRNITITNNYAILQEYDQVVNKNQYDIRMKEVEESYNVLKEKANKGQNNLNKDFMDAHQRYTKLIGKMGVIKVGGVSELEKHCIKDSVDDAVLACKSAFENGYIRGLNLSTLSILYKLSTHSASPITRDVIGMLYRVFEEMTLSVMRNKHPDDTEDREILINGGLNHTGKYNNKSIIKECIVNNYGYNLVTESIEDDDNLTVINSVSTDIEILKAIISILSLMLTSDQFLSVNRMYDRKVSRKQLIEQKAHDQAVIAETVTDALMCKLEKFVDNGDEGLFRKLISWIKSKIK